jgi:flagellar hook-basal body complex protein FliE
MNIRNIGNVQNQALEKLASQSGVSAPAVGGEKEGDFAQTLMDVMKEVNDSQLNAKQVGNDFMTGRHSVDYHDLMIAMERASTAMNLTLSVRNKLLEGYQEISRMQV